LTNAFGIGTSSSFFLADGQDKLDIGAGFYSMATAGNRVWEDTNENGVQDNGEPSVENVLVEAFEVETGQKVAEDYTNFSGVYAIEYLQKKDYYLKFNPPSGYGFTTPNNGGESIDSDVDHSFGYRTTDSYSMNPGQNYINIDAGLRFGVLPVEWLSVNVRNEGDINRITWETASEINSDYFEIQRSIDNTQSFEEVARVSAAGESSSIQSYSAIDNKLESGVHYYRIKQLDKDGKFEYSDIVSVTISDNKNLVRLSPNPTVNKSILDVSLSYGGDVSVKVVANDGRVVRSIVLTENTSGIVETRFEISDLPSGVYIVHISQGEFADVKRLIIVE